MSLAQVTEDCLAIAYGNKHFSFFLSFPALAQLDLIGRECVLSMLKHWPAQQPVIKASASEISAVASVSTATSAPSFSQALSAPILGSIACWDQVLCGLDQVSRFLRLCDFARVNGALDTMRVGVFRQLKSESKQVRQFAKTSPNMDMTRFSELAPLSRYLLDTALLHMVFFFFFLNFFFCISFLFSFF